MPNHASCPPGLPKLQYIRNIYLTDNKIEQCPWEFGFLTGLENLALGTNKYLTELPDELGGIINLKSLACNECKIGKIPKALHVKTRFLRDLDLSTNVSR